MANSAAGTYRALGLMSGSSLDGLDVALCRFELNDANHVARWSIDAAQTIDYPAALTEALRGSPVLGVRDLLELDAEVGRLVGRAVASFLQVHGEKARPSLVGYHGHTVFHEPARGFSYQLGDGAALATASGLPVVTQLRGADIAAGGQGAPLAPLADLHLFPDHRAFLNLGGIANLSLRHPDGTVIAGDISGCCQIMDRLTQERFQQPFDEGGALAAAGAYTPALAAKLDALVYHGRAYPKSLANDWVRDELWPALVENDLCSMRDRMHTFGVWLGQKVNRDLTALLDGGADAGAGGELEVLVTGGGARNTFLLEQLNAGPHSFEQAEEQVVDFKEAALIALCALFRSLGLPNALAGATGAERETVNGALYYP